MSDSDRNASANDPKVVYNRTAHEYLVVWHGSGLFDAPGKVFEIYGQRLSRTGKEIGSDFRISYTSDLGKINTNIVRSTSQVDVAWNSTNKNTWSSGREGAAGRRFNMEFPTAFERQRALVGNFSIATTPPGMLMQTRLRLPTTATMISISWFGVVVSRNHLRRRYGERVYLPAE